MKSGKNDSITVCRRFICGGILYMVCEIVFKTLVSHRTISLTMFFVGGTVYAGIQQIYDRSRIALIWRWLAAGGFCVAVEFISGLILNTWLKLDVWSYRNDPGNLLGNISPRWSAVWLAVIAGVFSANKLFELKRSTLTPDRSCNHLTLN